MPNTLANRLSLFVLLICLMASCSTGYQEVDGKPAFVLRDEGHGRRNIFLDGADSETLVVLSNKEYAKDKKNVYLNGYTVLGADPDTFELLDFPYAKDAIQAFCGTVPIKTENLESFQVLLGTTLTYYYDLGGPDFNEQVFGTLDIPPKTPIVVAHGWATDGQNCFFGPTKLSGLDVDTFRALDGHYAKDSKNAYFLVNTISGADVKTFSITSVPTLVE